jgi:hypothetical protein
MSYTTTARRSRNREVLPILLCTLAILGAAQLASAAPASAARTSFDGGPIAVDTATYVANDHTVYAMRFDATTGGANPLSAGTSYYVKIRFTPNSDGSPAGNGNRGFVWNGSAWVQERESDWALFPQVTTDSSGAIAESPWFYYCFGDATKSGMFYMIVSLSSGVSGSTRNSTFVLPVTVLDMSGTLGGTSTPGFWVHNGTALGAPYADARVEIDPGGGGAPWALTFTEPNAEFVMAAPVAQAFDVRLPGAVAYPPGAPPFTGTRADVNIALGAGDTTAPSAPGALIVAPGDTAAALTWGAATDDTGVAGYSVYRWTDPPAGATYTAQPVDVHDGSGTSWSDTGLTNGTTYHYLVRAWDAATNVGPRSNTVDATPKFASALSARTSATVVAWGGKATLSGTLTSSEGGGAALAGRPVKLQALATGGNWTAVTSTTTGASGLASVQASPTQATQYRLVFDGDATHGAVTSASVTVTPMVRLGAVSAPFKVKKGKSFSVFGPLTPKMSAGSKTVKIKCYLKKSGRWTLKKTFAARNSKNGSLTRYKASIKLTTKGSWQLVACSPKTAKYAETTAKAKIIKVK